MISLLCPTRGRPDRAMQFLDSVLSTQANDNEIIFGLQSDDPKLESYPQEIRSKAVIFEPSSTVYYWNQMAKQAKGDLLTLIADDVIMRTKGWDTKFEAVSKQYPDGMYLITTQDGRNHGDPPKDLPAPHPTITRKWFETLGYFTFPGLFHYYADTWNSSIARRLGRQVNLYDVMWEHIKEFDETRQVMRRNKWAELDDMVFKQCSRHWNTDLELIKSKVQQ
jgi:hypothetical protein